MIEAESKDAIRQICHGLEYIHDRNVVHRDVKPANILMQKGAGPFDLQVGRFWVSSANAALQVGGRWHRKQVCGHWHRKQVCGHWHRKERVAGVAHDIADHDIVVSSSRNLLAMPWLWHAGGYLVIRLCLHGNTFKESCLPRDLWHAHDVVDLREVWASEQKHGGKIYTSSPVRS